MTEAGASGTNLAQAWVTISPRTKGMQKEIDKQLKGIASKGEKTGSQLGEKITSGMKKSVKVGAVAAGAAGAAAFGAALKKGFDRLDAIEQAKVKFEALGYTAQEQASLMDDVTAAVKGTAFSTSEAADAAAMALAGGIKPGKELTGVLKTVGDSASFANKSFADVAPIYTKAINRGKVMGDTLMQLEENAIPATQALSKSMGKSAEEIQKMASKGQISFKDLQKAMDETIGGQALKAGDTFRGSLANIGAAWARVGETILNTPFNAAPKIFSGIADHIDVANAKLKGFLELFSTGDFTKEIGINLAGGDETNRIFEDDAMVAGILSFRDKSIEAIDTVKRKWDEFKRGFRGEDTEGMFGRLGTHLGNLADSAVRMAEPLGRVAASLGEAGMTASMVSLLAILEALTPLIDNILVPALDGLSRAMAENQGVVNVLVTAFVGMKSLSFVSGLFGGVTSALGGMAGVLPKVTGGMRALGLAIKANPIGAIVTGIAAAIAALTWFFTKTETGKQIWSNFMDFLKPIITWLGEKFTELGGIVSAMWESYIKPALSAFATVAQWAAAIVLTVLITPLMLAWKALSAAIKWGWETLVKPAWDALKVAAQFMWNSVLKPVFNAIKAAWGFMAQGIQNIWNSIIRPAWDALKAAAQFMWNTILQPVFNFIKAAWQAMANGIKWVWENIIRPAWDALKNALNALYNNVIKPVLQWIGDRWKDMSNVLKVVGDWIRTNVFDKLGEGLNKVKSWFRTAVDAIKKTWDRIGNIARKPVQFIVETVFNNGIRKAWNAVAGFVGLKDKRLDKLGPVAAYASGGVLPGYTPGRDVHNFYSPTGGRLALSGGEAIMRPEWTRAVGGPAAVEALNRQAKMGRLRPVGKHDKSTGKTAFADGGVLRFANGGVIDAMTRIVKQKYPGIQLTSSYRPGSADMHGQGLATDWATPGAFGNSAEQLALARDIAKTYPGSAELIYDHPGWSGNIKNGQNVGAFGQYYTLGQAGPHHHHVHWAMTTPPTMPFGGGVFKGGSSGGGGGGFNPVGALAKAAWDKVIDSIPKFKGEDSPWRPVPGGFLKKAASTMWDWIKSKLPWGGGSSGDVDLTGVKGDVVAKVQEVFKRHGWTGQQWEDAKWIIGKESGWNPTAVNPSSGAFGLFQLNPSSGTLQQYLPDRNPDPAVQANAGARYIKDRYGDPTAARRFWEANQWYDQGGYLKPGVTQVRNDTGKPEPVFTHDQWQVLKKSVLSNQQWADVAKPMVNEIEKFANGITVKQVDKPVAIDDPKARGSKANENAEGEATETTAEKEEVKPEEVGAQIASGLIEGQLDDIRSVFGLPALKDIPAVKAAVEANKAVVEAGGESHPAAEALEAGLLSPQSLLAMGRVAPQLANAGAATMAAAASGNPAAAAAAAKGAGQTVNIVVDSTQRAFSEYRKLQAKTSAGARGVR